MSLLPTPLLATSTSVSTASNERTIIEKRLRRGFMATDRNRDHAVDIHDLMTVLHQLQYKCSKRDAITMIWEADSNGDGRVTLQDIISMYYRVRLDKTGNEPYRLLDIIDFLSCADSSHTISTVEAISMLTQRSNAMITPIQVKTMSSSTTYDFGARVTMTEFARQMSVRRALMRKG